MSQFEYLGRISIGQYLPTNSIIHRRNPGIKLAAFSILIVAITLSHQMDGLIAALAFNLILLLLSKISLMYALRGLKSPMPFILILAIIQLFFISHQSSETALFSWKIFTINLSGIHAALMVILRFSNLVLLLTEASGTLSSLELIHGINLILNPLRLLGINTDSAAMVVQIMLRFIPTLALNAEKIAKSQASRGADWDNPRGGLFQRARQTLPLITPLFSVSLHQADTLTNAMLARAYGSNKKRTGLYEYRLDWQDGVFFSFNLIAAYLILFWPL